MTETMNLTSTYTTEHCLQCPGTWAWPEDDEQRLRRSHKTFHCPYCGNRMHYGGKSDLEKAKDAAREATDQLTLERARHDQTQESLRHARRRHTAQKAATTRLKNRAAAGLCPCCNRHFANLGRHMANQHPKFAKSCDNG